MKRYLKQFGGGIGICALAAGMMAGCASGQADPGTENTSQEENGNFFEEGQQWTEEIVPEYAGNKGNSVISIDAKLAASIGEQMYVVEVEREEFDEAYRERVLKAFFGNSQIYYYDREHASREQLQEMIDESREQVAYWQEVAESTQKQLGEWKSGEQTFDLKKLIAYGEEELKSSKENLQKESAELKKMEEQLAAAPEELTPAADYSVQEYLGYVNGIPFQADFTDSVTDGGYRNVELKIYPKDYRDVAVEELKEMAEVYIAILGPATMEESGLNYEDEKGNMARISLSSAMQKAEGFVGAMDMGEVFCAGGSTALWIGFSQKQGEETTNRAYGYVIDFDWGIEGRAFGESGYLWDYNRPDGGKAKDGAWTWNSRLSVIVTDEGVIELSLQNPIRIRKQSQVENCLPIEQVQEIMRQELSTNPDYILLKEEPVRYNQMDLIYFPVKSEKEENVYCYTPAWRLSQNAAVVGQPPEYRNAIIVNAMDGSIIDWGLLFTAASSQP